jgi:hypothetical protein
MQNLRFVSIRKLEVIEMGRVIRSFNRGVSIRRAVASDEWRVASRFVMKNRRIFAIRKMEAIENAAVIWISNSRFAIRNEGRQRQVGEWRSPAGPGRIVVQSHDSC